MPSRRCLWRRSLRGRHGDDDQVIQPCARERAFHGRERHLERQGEHQHHEAVQHEVARQEPAPAALPARLEPQVPQLGPGQAGARQDLEHLGAFHRGLGQVRHELTRITRRGQLIAGPLDETSTGLGAAAHDGLRPPPSTRQNDQTSRLATNSQATPMKIQLDMPMVGAWS